MEKIRFKKGNKTKIKVVTGLELMENGWEIDEVLEVMGAYNF